MSDWPRRWLLRLQVTIDRGGDTACGHNCYCLCLRWFSVACMRSGFVMIARTSAFGLGVDRVPRRLAGMGMLGMLDVGMDATWRIETVWMVRLGAGALRLLVPCIVVAVNIYCRCVADAVDVTHWVISATRALFSKDEGVEFWPWIVQGTELPPWEESLSPGCTETRHLAGGSWEFPKVPHLCWFWDLARLRSFCATGVMSG